MSFDLLPVACGILVSILVNTSSVVSWAGEGVIPVYEEPLHQLVFEREPVRVLDVRLQPGDTSLYHLHEDPIFYIALDISEIDAQVMGEEWQRTRVAEWSPGATAYDLGHAEQPTIHRIRNVGDTTFRLIAVTNNGSPEHSEPVSESELPGVLETDVEYFRQSRITLAPGGVGERFRSLHPVVVVQVTPGSAELAYGGVSKRALGGPGAFSFVVPGRDSELRNSGGGPVTLVVVEVR